MSRVRRLEARQQKEATEREKKESAREQRRKEREQRELQAQQAPATSRNARYLNPSSLLNMSSTCVPSADPHVDVISDHPSAKRTHPNGVHPRKSGHVNGSASGSGSGTRTPAGEEWELDCEICYRRGINQVHRLLSLFKFLRLTPNSSRTMVSP